MTTGNDPIDTFLARLREASAHLPPDVRQELLDDVGLHLEEIRHDAGNEVAVRDALDRLGAPEEIVAAAGQELGSEVTTATLPPPESPAPRLRSRDVLAVILVVAGPLIAAGVFIVFPPLIIVGAIVAYVTGLVLLWSAPIWRAGEKLLLTLIWPGGVATPLALGTIATRTCITEETSDGLVQTTCEGFALPPAIGIPLALAAVAAPIVIGAILLVRASRRSPAVN